MPWCFDALEQFPSQAVGTEFPTATPLPPDMHFCCLSHESHFFVKWSKTHALCQLVAMADVATPVAIITIQEVISFNFMLFFLFWFYVFYTSGSVFCPRPCGGGGSATPKAGRTGEG
jgi:hypothetical protein